MRRLIIILSISAKSVLSCYIVPVCSSCFEELVWKKSIWAVWKGAFSLKLCVQNGQVTNGVAWWTRLERSLPSQATRFKKHYVNLTTYHWRLKSILLSLRNIVFRLTITNLGLELWSLVQRNLSLRAIKYAKTPSLSRECYGANQAVCDVLC